MIRSFHSRHKCLINIQQRFSAAAAAEKADSNARYILMSCVPPPSSSLYGSSKWARVEFEVRVGWGGGREGTQHPTAPPRQKHFHQLSTFLCAAM